MRARRRVALSVASFAAAAGLVAFGILHEEVGEVLFNACMLCLSCIGMG